MTIDFENDTAFIFGHKAKLIVTKSRHNYALPISPYTQLLNNLATNKRIHITLTTQGEKSKFQLATKFQTSKLCWRTMGGMMKISSRL